MMALDKDPNFHLTVIYTNLANMLVALLICALICYIMQ